MNRRNASTSTRMLSQPRKCRKQRDSAIRNTSHGTRLTRTIASVAASSCGSARFSIVTWHRPMHSLRGRKGTGENHCTTRATGDRKAERLGPA